MTRRRARVLVLTLLLLAACSDGGTDVATEGEPADDSASTTTTTEQEPGTAPIIVADGRTIGRIVDGVIEPVGVLDGTVAVAYGDGHGSYAAQVEDRLVVLYAGEQRVVDTERPGRVILYDLVWQDGSPHALYGVREDDGEPSGPIVLHDLDTDEQEELGPGYAVEHHTSTVSLRNGLLATSSTADLTEVVDVRPVDGDADEDAWTPTKDLEYNAPPFITSAVLAPDGETIAWLSGPDHDGKTNQPDVGSWEVVVADLGGNERHRIALDIDDEIPSQLDYDGTRVLVSRRTGDAPASPLLIDLPNGTKGRLPINGTATFEG